MVLSSGYSFGFLRERTLHRLNKNTAFGFVFPLGVSQSRLLG
jgi:hypothetical protein